MLSMAAIASALPEVPTQRLIMPTTTSNADMNIGIERMRITNGGHIMINSSGRLGISVLPPDVKLEVI
jgi:hypothetical protein